MITKKYIHVTENERYNFLQNKYCKIIQYFTFLLITASILFLFGFILYELYLVTLYEIINSNTEISYIMRYIIKYIYGCLFIY